MFLSITQKEQLLKELKYAIVCGHNHLQKVSTDITEKGSDSEYLLFTDPDSQQVAIKVNDDIWIYSEHDIAPYCWDEHNDVDVEYYRTETMNFDDYTTEELEHWVKAYQKSLESHKEVYGDDWKQIALECVFEQVT
jgi:hypothetical protein